MAARCPGSGPSNTAAGQEAASLHDDGGEVQHEVGEAVQPALLLTGSGGAGLGQEPAGEK